MVHDNGGKENKYKNGKGNFIERKYEETKSLDFQGESVYRKR